MIDLAIASLVVFLVNAMPALMPPTWTILAFLHFALDIPVLPLVICGALSAAGGRLALALLARRYGTRLLPATRRAKLERLGVWLDAKARWAAPVAVLVYSVGPIPSNQVFIAAGLTRMSLGRIFAAFLAGRLVAYPLWIGVAHVAVDRLDALFVRRLTDLPGLLVELALLAVLILFTRVDWERVIARFDPSFAPRTAPSGVRGADRTPPPTTFDPREALEGERASRP